MVLIWAILGQFEVSKRLNWSEFNCLKENGQNHLAQNYNDNSKSDLIHDTVIYGETITQAYE